MTRNQKIGTAVVAAVLVVLGIIALTVDTDEVARDSDSGLARDACRESVTKQLEVGGIKFTDEVEKPADDRYTVTGTATPVDRAPRPYSCTLTRADGYVRGPAAKIDPPVEVIAACHTAAAAKLRDPSSAMFDGDTATTTGTVGVHSGGTAAVWRVRGRINGKNGFGAYAGATPYTCVAWDSADGIDTTSVTVLGD